LQEIMAEFEKLTMIPYMWEPIDGCLIKKKLKDDQVLVDCFNCFKFHCLVLQEVCDHKRRFLNVCVQALGGSNDVAHLQGSTL